MAVTYDRKLRDANGKSMDDYSADYTAAALRGDAAGMKAANDAANALRVAQGGTAESAAGHIQQVASGESKPTLSTVTQYNTGNYFDTYDVATNTRKPSATEEVQRQLAEQAAAEEAELARQREADAAELLRQRKAAELQASLASLRGAYEASMNGYEDAAARLPTTYQSARNAAAAQNALAQTGFDERAAAMGLSSGARGQAELSRSAALKDALSQIDRSEADAQSDIDLERNNLTAQYESTVAKATAQNEAELTDALYQELLRRQQTQREDAARAEARELEMAQLAAGYGDYSGLNKLGVNTSAYEAQQQSLAERAAAEAAAYQPTFTAAQVTSAKQNADKNGTALEGNMLRDYYYYYFGNPDYGSAGALGATGSGASLGGAKDVDTLAREVIAGAWGNGDARRRALTDAGYDAAAVQARVNQLMPTTPRVTPTTGTGGGTTRMTSGQAITEAAQNATTQTGQLLYLKQLFDAGRITQAQLDDLSYSVVNPGK